MRFGVNYLVQVVRESKAAVDVNAEVDNLTQRYGSDKYSVRTVVKKGMLLWEKVPISVTKEIDDLLIEMVEPFNYDQLEPFAG